MSSTAQYKLSVIIVNYNVKYYVEQCLLSVQKALNGINAEVFVVDNHSRDASVEYLTDRFPHVRVISSNHNLGFARANNIAIRQYGAICVAAQPRHHCCRRHFSSSAQLYGRHPTGGRRGRAYAQC